MTPDNAGPVQRSSPTADADGEVYVISFPKCGRTWLRVLLARAISEAHRLPMELCRDLDLTHFTAADPAVPRIVFWHDDRVAWRAPGELSSDKEFYRDRKVVLLVRDIRDVAVSHYFQRTRREGNPFTGTLGEFLSEDVGSVRTCLEFWNIWQSRQHTPAAFLLSSYERLSADTTGELARILDFCGLPGATDPATLRAAAEYAGFDAMRAMERDDTLRSEKLRPAVPGDPESYKTRRGVVGGYRDYLDQEQIGYVDTLVRDLLAPPWQSLARAADGRPGAPPSWEGRPGRPVHVRPR
ncbi:sulfotransferase domain-containing protein [Streptomyces sp. NPDC002793]|uniref:sulfotransferase domain-containing protein n=1 Tax=Streptomyces sp. NPDC002793 TaxID=3154432 RepID=UPI003324D80D